MFKIIGCAIAEIFVVAWWLMLLIGALHAQVSYAIWPVGYGGALGISACLCFMIGSIIFWNLVPNRRGLNYLLGY